MLTNKDLAAELVKLLAAKNLEIAFAESCTGGLVAGAITDISGSSQVLKMSVVTYCDQAKNQLVAVPNELLQKYTAVSKEVAEAMAVGVKNLAKSKIGIGVTGIAGPGGGSAEQPVGLVYIGIAGKAVASYRYVFKGNRQQVREQAVAECLKLALQSLEQI